ncbi:MAG: efflux RND transporter periplasmic adaptor subunit [Gemmatimonadota bacterium]
MKLARVLPLVALVGACSKPAPLPVYQAVAVERRDIIVTAQAAGAVNPDTVVQVKSKASGEILDVKVQTGDFVKRGTLMVQVDQRIPQNDMQTAQANQEVAKAQLANAQGQLNRAKELFTAKAITQQELETATLAVANSKADVVRQTIALENAKITLGDTRVLAPISGTVIEQQVQRGNVISSPNTASGGTVLLTMADLSLVQIKTYVDETDIGKLRAGLPANVTVNAFPNRPFRGEVLKIEPQADTIQNVTMFPVLIRIDNKDGLLKPGMNAEVKMQVGERKNVLAVPNAALRTERDVKSAGTVLGIADADLTRMLAEAKAAVEPAPTAGDSAKKEVLPAGDPSAAAPKGDAAARQGGAKQGAGAPAAGGNGGGNGGGNPAGAGTGGGNRGGGMRRGGGGGNAEFGGTYIVFVQRAGKPVPVYVKTGLTDLDYSEVKSGLTEKDSVLMLPSASFVQSQQDLQTRMKGAAGGLPGQSTTPPAAGARPAGGAAPAGGGKAPGGR